MFRTFCPDKDSEHVLLRTLCPDSQYEDVRTEVAGCLAREWPRIDRWVKEQHCSDAARCIGKSVHASNQERPSFIGIVLGMKRLQLSMAADQEIWKTEHSQ
eukprot:2396250-Amphidinium_carterae.1